MRQSSSEVLLAELSSLSQVDRGSNISEIHRQAENPLESLNRRRPPSLNSITAALYTIHQRQRRTGCSFQLLFAQIPTEISFLRTMHFFTSEKRRKKINIWFQYTWKPINTLPGPPFLCSSSRSSLRRWPMVNRNNGEWLLGGQGAAGAANEAADEGARYPSSADGTVGTAGKSPETQPLLVLQPATRGHSGCFAAAFPPGVGARSWALRGPPLRLTRTPPSSSVCHGGRGRSIRPHGARKQRHDKQTAEGPTHHFKSGGKFMTSNIPN